MNADGIGNQLSGFVPALLNVSHLSRLPIVNIVYTVTGKSKLKCALHFNAIVKAIEKVVKFRL